MKKKVLRKISKMIVNAITAVMGIVFVLSMCAADSEAWLPVIIAFVISGSWLTVVAWANGWLS